MTLGYCVEYATGTSWPAAWRDVLTECGSTFVFTELSQALYWARDVMTRHPELDGFVRVSGGVYRLYPHPDRPMRVSVGGKTVWM